MEVQRISRKHCKSLTDCFSDIVDIISQEVDDIVNYLRITNCIDEELKQKILSKKEDREKTRHLLHTIFRCSDRAFYELCNALYTHCFPQCEQILAHLIRDEAFVPSRQRLLSDQAKEYYHQLQEIHKENLDRGLPEALDLGAYIKLTLYPAKMKLQAISEMRRGDRELILCLARTHGSPIEPPQMFHDGMKDVRCVLLIGAPGAGKTMTAFYLLNEHIRNCLWPEFEFAFLILFREINDFHEKVSFQDLLFNHFGPFLNDTMREKVWKYIKKNGNSLLFILDGFDECSGLGVDLDKQYTIPFRDTSERTKIQTILYNLICGKIMPEARVLITSRPHCVDQFEDNIVHRTIELGGLDHKQLEDLIDKLVVDKPLLSNSLKRYLQSNVPIRSLCSNPVNARGLLNLVMGQVEGKEDSEICTGILPTSRAGLMFLLIINLFREHCRPSKEYKNMDIEELISVHQKLLLKLSCLAYSAIFDGQNVKQVFNENDLGKHNLSKKEVTEAGLMTGHVAVMSDFFKKINKTLLSFPHLTYQENLAALQTSQDRFNDLLSSVEQNFGEKDVVILHTIGFLADPLCQSFIALLFPDYKENIHSQRCDKLLQAIWQSPRRCKNDGSLFCITALFESLQNKFLSGRLKEYLVTALGSLYLWDVVLTPADFSPLAQFLQHQEIPFKEVVLSVTDDLNGLDELLQARGYCGLTMFATKYTSESIEHFSKALDRKNELTHLLLRGNRESTFSSEIWEKFELSENCPLRALGLLWGMLDSENTLLYLCNKLKRLPVFEALYVQKVPKQQGDRSGLIISLQMLSKLKYLRLDECEIGKEDIPHILKLLHRKSTCIEWLDLSNNPLTDDGVVQLARGLADSKLKGLRLSGSQVGKCGMEEIGHIVKVNKCMTMLTVGYGTCTGGVEPLSSALGNGCILCDLILYKCKLSEADQKQLVMALRENSSVKWLSMSGDTTYHSVICALAECLAVNTQIQALTLRDTTMTDELLSGLVPALSETATLELLDISENNTLSASPITQIMCCSRLKHLAMSDCHLSSEGWIQIAQALTNNNHLKQIVVGDAGKEQDLHNFLNIMCSYPCGGPLRHLMMYGDREQLTVHMCKLQNCLLGRCTVNFVTFALPFLVLSDLWYRDLPRDMRIWLVAAHTAIK